MVQKSDHSELIWLKNYNADMDQLVMQHMLFVGEKETVYKSMKAFMNIIIKAVCNVASLCILITTVASSLNVDGEVEIDVQKVLLYLN